MQRVEVYGLAGPAPAAVVHAGSWSGEVPCALDRAGERLELPAEVLWRLGIRAGQRVHVFTPDGGRQIWVGPLVGIVLRRRALTRMQDGTAKSFRRWVRDAREIGVIPCFIQLAGIDRAAGRVRGLVEREGRFERVRLPLPDVIYNRATYNNRQERAAASATRRALRDLDGVTQLNNANAFSKWEVAAALGFFPDTAHLAPETVRFEDPDSLAAMLDRHPRVFLKADWGSHGAQVLRVSTGPDGWEVRGHCGRRRVGQAFAEPGKLYGFLRQLTGDDPWVLQQGIDLPEVYGNPVDIRTIVQKDGRGEWQVPRVVVRVGRPGQVVTSLSRGGHPFPAALFLELYGADVPELAGAEQKATTVARQVALVLEARFGLLGEVGVDIGIDREGRPWVFEANAKPFHRRIPGLPQPLHRYPLEYAVYLAERAWTGRDSGLSRPTVLRA